MSYRPPRSWVERVAVRLGLIRGEPAADGPPGGAARRLPLQRHPPPQTWHQHIEYDPACWPHEARPRRYFLAPTTCFNCEAACGLLAYVDRDTRTIRKFEGNPLHPASRGRNCAKGPATLNQVNDPDRILTPLRRVGRRGEGRWRPVSWDEVLAEVGGRIRRALQEGRRDEVVYHVGRPGAEGFMDRVLRAWGIDGHNSHTNICSSSARLGYALWWGYDRPSPDYAHAQFILALNAHLESGHYFNPHAQRIVEALSRGARLAVVDPRLSNTASMATFWLPAVPGTEAALLLALAHVILDERLYDRAFIERWVNWRESLEFLRTRARAGPPGAADAGDDRAGCAAGSASPAAGADVDDFLDALKRWYAPFTPHFAEQECGIPAETIVEVARRIGQAGPRFCSHIWRGAASGHLGGWQVARCLMLLHALTGSVGTPGGVLPAGWSKYKASLINMPPPQDHWNELHWPREYPLAHYEMSFLLPHFLKEGRGRIDVYFTRVFNPVWTYPDGFSWIEALCDEQKIGLHVALTPTWNETAFFADYVLPMGHGPERHDLNTYETHSGTWIAFRQPVLKALALAEGRAVPDTRAVNPGQVWEEDEFWIALSWAIDPDGSLGIRRYFESPTRPGQMLTVDEYYAHAFERVPGLPQAAAREGLTPLDYMRRYGAFEIKAREYLRHERPLPPAEREAMPIDPATGERLAVEGFPTPSRKLEFFSSTLAEWGWPEHAVPDYVRSHVCDLPRPARGTDGSEGPAAAGSQGPAVDRPQDATAQPTVGAKPGGAFAGRGAAGPGRSLSVCLLPTFRLPTLIHTRSGAAKWLNEISQQNPVWMHPSDAAWLGLRTGDLVRVNTRIGYFVDRVWVTEGIRPGVVACSHHLGRWRRPQDPPNSRWSGSIVQIDPAPEVAQTWAPGSDSAPVVEEGADRSPGRRWRLRIVSGPGPFESADPDSRRVWWREGGVHQNLAFPVQPDPVSGMHCWHQRVSVEPAQAGDRYGDVLVDTARSMEVYREWLACTRWPVGPPGPDGQRLRRPLWLNRPLRPADSAYRI